MAQGYSSGSSKSPQVAPPETTASSVAPIVGEGAVEGDAAAMQGTYGNAFVADQIGSAQETEDECSVLDETEEVQGEAVVIGNEHDTSGPPDAEPPPDETPVGAAEGRLVGTWVGLPCDTPLFAGALLGGGFEDAGVATALGKTSGGAAVVIREGDTHNVYRLSYDTMWSEFTRAETQGGILDEVSCVTGSPGVVVFVTTDSFTLTPSTMGRGGPVNEAQSYETEDLAEEIDDPLADLQGARGEGLEDIAEDDDATLLLTFGVAMREVALDVLAKSESEAARMKAEYAAGTVAADPAEFAMVVDELARIDEETRAANTELTSLYGVAGVAEDPSTPEQESLEGYAADPKVYERIAELEQRVQADTELSGLLLTRYPILGRIQDIQGFRDDPEAQASILDGTCGDVLASIATTRENIAGGDLSLWALPRIVETTADGLGLDGVRREKVLAHAAAEKQWDDRVDLALTVLEVGFGLAALVATGGFGALYLGAALGTAGAAVGGVTAVNQTGDYMVDSAASGTDVDPNEALLDPATMEGAEFALALAWAGIGLSALEALDAVKLLRAGGVLGDVAKTTGVAEDELRAAAVGSGYTGRLGRAIFGEDSYRKALLDGLPDEMKAAGQEIQIRVLPDDEFMEEFASESGQAVTVTSGGKVQEVVVRESANPRVMLEEAVHIEQCADPAIAEKIATLDSFKLDEWDLFDEHEQIAMYRTKLEVEVDAQQRLIPRLEAAAAKGDKEAAAQLADAQEGLATMEERLVIVDKAVDDPALLADEEWWDPDQPAWLFNKLTPAQKAYYEGLPVINGKRARSPGFETEGWDPETGILRFPEGSEAAAIAPDGVRYDKAGCPDLKPFQQAEVQITGFTSDRAKNMRLADKEMRVQTKNPKWKRPADWTWHEERDLTTMRLVPSPLHDDCAHTGGVAMAKEREKAL